MKGTATKGPTGPPLDRHALGDQKCAKGKVINLQHKHLDAETDIPTKFS